MDCSDGAQMHLHLFDYDNGPTDDDLGRATIEVANIAKKGQDDMWITLEQATKGTVHLRLTWLKLSSQYDDLKASLAETQMLRVTTLHTAIFCLYVDSARMLLQTRTSTKPDPYLVITVGKYTQQTTAIMRTTDPVWEQGFTFLVSNPEADTVYFKVMDHKTGNEMGELVYQLTTLSQRPNLDLPQQPFGLKKSGPESKLIMSMYMRILKSNIPEEIETVQNSDLTRQASTVSATSSVVPPSPVRKQQVSREASISSTAAASSIPAAGGSLVETETTTAEEVFEDESIPLMTSAAIPETSSLSHRSPSLTSSSGDHGLGRIQLTLRYSVQRQKLIIVIHKVANIPLKDPSNIPDPYVKLYLLPDRAKETKRKTVVVKDNCNPVFDESFEYLISQGELTSQELEITVCTQKQLFYSSSNVLGQVVIDLSDNFTQAINAWFDLLPEKN